MLVFDASTLIILARAELLRDFLGSFAGKIAIPGEVAKECCGYKKTLDAALIQKAVDDGEIEVVAGRPRNIGAQLKYDRRLGKGQAEGLALAFKQEVDL